VADLEPIIRLVLDTAGSDEAIRRAEELLSISRDVPSQPSVAIRLDLNPSQESNVTGRLTLQVEVCL
jgi:hypothetical protein